MSDRVWMVHPDLPGQRISCHRNGVGMRQASGWMVDEGQDVSGDAAAPAYVHRLLDAYLTGAVLDFGAEAVPVDVQARLSGQFETSADVPAGTGDDVAASAAEESKE